MLLLMKSVEAYNMCYSGAILCLLFFSFERRLTLFCLKVNKKFGRVYWGLTQVPNNSTKKLKGNKTKNSSKMSEITAPLGVKLFSMSSFCPQVQLHPLDQVHPEVTALSAQKQHQIGSHLKGFWEKKISEITILCLLKRRKTSLS